MDFRDGRYGHVYSLMGMAQQGTGKTRQGTVEIPARQNLEPMQASRVGIAPRREGGLPIATG